jgi:hypothetical protein
MLGPQYGELRKNNAPCWIASRVFTDTAATAIRWLNMWSPLRLRSLRDQGAPVGEEDYLSKGDVEMISTNDDDQGQLDT